MSWHKSPVFWGAIAAGAATVGAVFYRRRRDLLGRSPAGPAPRVIERNTAKMPTPTEVRHVGGRTLARYDMASMSIHERLKLIQKRAWDGVHDPRIRQLALQLTQSCGRDDGACEAKAIFDAVKARVRYTGDIGPIKNPKTGAVEAIDYYQSPMVTWEYRGGDCDDATALVGALLTSIGHTVRLRVTAESKFGEDGHIYPVTILPKDDPRKAYAVDITLPWSNSTVGSEAKYAKAKDYKIEAPI